MSVEVIGQNLIEVAIAPPPVIEVEVEAASPIEIEVLPGGIVYRGEETTSLNSNSFVAEYSLSALRAVIVNNDSRLEYASSNIAEHSFSIVGVLKDAIAVGDSGKALIQGSLSDSSWNWTLGTPIYLGVDGMLTQSAPSTGFQIILGKPTSPTTVYFEIGEPILL